MVVLRSALGKDLLFAGHPRNTKSVWPLLSVRSDKGVVAVGQEGNRLDDFWFACFPLLSILFNSSAIVPAVQVLTSIPTYLPLYLRFEHTTNRLFVILHLAFISLIYFALSIFPQYTTLQQVLSSSTHRPQHQEEALLPSLLPVSTKAAESLSVQGTPTTNHGQRSFESPLPRLIGRFNPNVVGLYSAQDAVHKVSSLQQLRAGVIKLRRPPPLTWTAVSPRSSNKKRCCRPLQESKLGILLCY